jgi:MFS family permease
MATRDTQVATGLHGQTALSSKPAAPGARAWVVLGMLCFVYVINFLCRQLPSILAKPIEDTLHITDGQFGLIGGFYFALFYCFISIPVGYLADKTSRSKVLAIACAIWSGATMACGFAVGYLQFAISYMTVGFGEAGGVPPSYAIISDYFPPGRRGTALGLYNLGPPIGIALAVAFGASIAAAFSWQLAFKALGAVGVVTVVLILLIVREPVRGGLDAPNQIPVGKAGFWPTFTNFFSRPTLILAALGSGANQIVTYGFGNFTVLCLMREKGMTLREVAAYYSIAVAIGMSGSMFVSGRAIDFFARRSKRAYGLVPAISLVFAIPLYIAFLSTPTWNVALLFLTGVMFFNYFYLSSSVTLIQQEVRPDQRVMSGALLLLVMNFIGLGLGPTYVGAASDFLRASYPQHSLLIALYTLVPFYFIAIFLFLALSRALRNEIRKAGETAR